MQLQQLQESFASKVQRGIFQPVARHLVKTEDTENRLADAVAQTWETYQRCATDQGKVLSDGALVQHCMWRATDPGRHFVRGWHCRNQDVLDPRAFRAGHVRVLRIDGVPDDEEHGGHAPVELGFAQAQCPSPERNMNSAVDLQRWLAGLSERDRELLSKRMAGETLTDIGGGVGWSATTTHRRLRELGHELAGRCGVSIQA